MREPVTLNKKCFVNTTVEDRAIAYCRLYFAHFMSYIVTNPAVCNVMSI
jgi:hypothetical protein